MSIGMLVLFGLLFLSVLAIVGVAVATWIRVRKKVDAQREEPPGGPNDESQ